MKRLICMLLAVLLFAGSVMLGVSYHQEVAFDSAEFAAELKALDGVAEHRLMVKSDRKLDLHGAVQTAESGGLYVLQYDSKEAAQKAYDDYRALKCVQYVCFDGDDLTPCSDTYSIQDTAIEYNCVGKAITNADDAMKLIKKHYQVLPKIKVGVIDTGLAKNRFTKKRIDGGHSFVETFNADGTTDKNGHGSKVGSVVINNTFDNVRLYSFQTADASGNGVRSYLISSIYLAADDGCRIINISQGVSAASEDVKTAIQDAIDYAYQHDSIVVCSAGNDGMDLTGNTYKYPATAEHILCVGNSDRLLRKASNSNYGEPVDFFATGSNITVYNKSGGQTEASGTSFSSPLSVAIIANMISVSPNLTIEEIEQLVQETGNALNEDHCTEENQVIIDAYALLQQLLGDSLESVTLDYTAVYSEEAGAYQVAFSSTDAETIYYNSADCIGFNGAANDNTLPGEIRNLNGPYRIYATGYAEDKAKSRDCYFKIAKFNEEYAVSAGTDISPYNKLTSCSVTDTEITLPSVIDNLEIQMIGDRVFLGNKSIETVILPVTVKEIGSYTFANCPNLRTVVAPGVEKCGQYAFYNCPQLKFVEMPQLTYVNTAMFKNCTSLTCFDIGDSVPICIQAFASCDSLNISDMAHNYEAVGYESIENDTMIMLKCSKCGNEMQVSFMEHINTDYTLLDINHDNIVNAKDLAYIIKEPQRS